MALITLSSAHGAPGTTTTALGLALAWPRPVLLVEADPSGANAIAAGYFQGGQMPHEQTVVDLALALRQDTVEHDFPRMLIELPGNPHAQLLRGPVAHTQAPTLRPTWEPLAGLLHALDSHGQDAVVDCGRLGVNGFPRPLLRAADVSLLVTHTSTAALVGASSWIQELREEAESLGGRTRFGLCLVGEKRPYSRGEVERAFHVPVLSTIAWDPKHAPHLSEGAAQPRFMRTALGRSLRSEAERLALLCRPDAPAREA